LPTYEYACSNCGHRVEETRRIDDPPLTKCERCGGPMRKVFHPAGIVFKGSGFYATDSRSKPPPKKDDKKEKTPASSGDSSGSESGSSDSGQKKTEPKTGGTKPSEGKSSP
jgi:putative FmdB family regulatory protein